MRCSPDIGKLPENLVNFSRCEWGFERVALPQLGTMRIAIEPLWNLAQPEGLVQASYFSGFSSWVNVPERLRS